MYYQPCKIKTVPSLGFKHCIKVIYLATITVPYVWKVNQIWLECRLYWHPLLIWGPWDPLVLQKRRKEPSSNYYYREGTYISSEKGALCFKTPTETLVVSVTNFFKKEKAKLSSYWPFKISIRFQNTVWTPKSSHLRLALKHCM